jgi:hypothetical protein
MHQNFELIARYQGAGGGSAQSRLGRDDLKNKKDYLRTTNMAKAQAQPSAKVAAKKRVVKVDSYGDAHISATFNNIIISLTNKNGQIISWSSAGKMGFRGSKRILRMPRRRLQPMLQRSPSMPVSKEWMFM